MAVVDPRFSNTAAHAHYWVPIKPGTDAALAMGMARWMVDNGSFDRRFLTAPTREAAAKINETCWTDATYLVNLKTNRFLRPSEAGLSGAATDYVVSVGGRLMVHTQVDTADLEVSAAVNEIPVKSSFRLTQERLRERTLEEYAAICGVGANLIVDLAIEFAAHGKKSVANPYRGPCQHTNGVYSVLAIHLLNILAGNFDWQGGNAGGGGATNIYSGSGKAGQVDVTQVPRGLSPTGVQITRVGATYDEDAPNLFNRDKFPAKRPWFPFATMGNYQEVIPSIFDQYPYPVKALITYWNDFPYSTPAQREIFEKTVADENKLPLFVAFDIEMSEIAAWADYVLPDTTVLERWSAPQVAPAILTRTDGIRQPVVGRFDGRPPDAAFNPDAKNDYQGFLPGTRIIEDIFIDLGKRLGLPGIGDNAFVDGSPLHNAWDWYKHLLKNLSIEYGYTPAEILARGGYFEDPGKEYSSDGKMARKFANALHLFIEPLATTRDSMTGKFFDPMFKHDEIRDVLDGPVSDTTYPFQIVTYKPIFHAQGRTANNPTLMALMPNNWVEMAASDGKRLGLESGDPVRVISPSGTIEENAVVKLSEGMRPGVVAVAHSYGHWEMSSRRFTIDGRQTSFDASRGAGIQINPILRLDPVLGNVCLQDKIGGSASFYDTRVRIEKLSERR